MTGGDVRNLVRHNTGQLRLVVSCQKQSLVDIKKSTRQSESIHFIRIYNLNRKWNLRIGMENNVLTNSIHVLSDKRIFNELRLSIDLSSSSSSLSHFLLGRAAHLCDYSSINIPLADHVGVFVGR